jgi:hypothetical protein
MRTEPNLGGVNSYLKIFESSLFSLPVERPEGVIGHEEVVNQLTEVTVDYDSGLGLRGEFSDVFQVYLKVEKDKYAVAIGWYVVWCRNVGVLR